MHLTHGRHREEDSDVGQGDDTGWCETGGAWGAPATHRRQREPTEQGSAFSSGAACAQPTASVVCAWGRREGSGGRRGKENAADCERSTAGPRKHSAGIEPHLGQGFGTHKPELNLRFTHALHTWEHMYVILVYRAHAHKRVGEGGRAFLKGKSRAARSLL